MSGRDPDDRPYYGPARITAGLVLIGAAVAYLVVTTAQGRDPDGLTLGLLLGAGCLFLGVEGASRLIR